METDKAIEQETKSVKMQANVWMEELQKRLQLLTGIDRGNDRGVCAVAERTGCAS